MEGGNLFWRLKTKRVLLACEWLQTRAVKEAACPAKGTWSQAAGSAACGMRSSLRASQRELKMRTGKWVFLCVHVYMRIVGNVCVGKRVVGSGKQTGEII